MINVTGWAQMESVKNNGNDGGDSQYDSSKAYSFSPCNLLKCYYVGSSATHKYYEMTFDDNPLLHDTFYWDPLVLTEGDVVHVTVSGTYIVASVTVDSTGQTLTIDTDRDTSGGGVGNNVVIKYTTADTDYGKGSIANKFVWEITK